MREVLCFIRKLEHTTVRFQILLFIVFELDCTFLLIIGNWWIWKNIFKTCCLPVNWTGSCHLSFIANSYQIFNSSIVLQCLATILQTIVSNFSSSTLTWCCWELKPYNSDPYSNSRLPYSWPFHPGSVEALRIEVPQLDTYFKGLICLCMSMRGLDFYLHKPLIVWATKEVCKNAQVMQPLIGEITMTVDNIARTPTPWLQGIQLTVLHNWDFHLPTS